MKLRNLLLISVLMSPAAVWAQEPAAPEAKIALPGLSQGDQIDVRLFDLPDLNSAPLHVIVAPDGTIHLPYVGAVQVLGLSPNEVESAIVDALRTKGIVKDPNVSVDIVSAVNMSVQVNGQVGTPSIFPLFAPAPMSYVLARVGGPNGIAGKHITIIHRGDQPPTSIDFDNDSPTTASLNTIVYPGDIVHVSNAGVVFMVGEVNRPGVYPITGAFSLGQVSAQFGMGVVKHMTLLQALTEAGGVTAIAARSKCRLLRTVEGKREEILIDIVKLEKGETADPLLHPDDIIYVPSSYIRSVTNNIFPTALSALYAASTVKTF